MGGDHSHDAGCGCGCGCSSGPVRNAELEMRWREADDSEVVCPCAGADKAAVRRAVESGAFTVPLLKVMTGAGRGDRCRDFGRDQGGCAADLEAFISLYGGQPR